MLRVLAALFIALLTGTAQADPRGDAQFFVSHFIGQVNWDRALHTSQRLAARLHRDALLARNVVILDRGRFTERIPPEAAEELVESVKAHVEALVLAHYGADHLAEIVAFFRTPTGEKMLQRAARVGLFDRLHYQSASDGLAGKLPKGLPLLDHNRYRSFTATAAGRAFLETTWVLRRSLYYEIHEVSRWPEPSLNRPYMITIIEAGGILKLPNRVARQAFIASVGGGGS